MLIRCFISFAFTAIVVVGCGSPNTPAVVAPTVSGEITLDGESLANAKVVFVPQKLMDRHREVIPLAYGLTDENGKFELTLSDGSTGIHEGDYRVIISKRVEKSDGQRLRLSDIVEEFESLVPDGFTMFRNQVLRDELLPERYNENTILIFKVEPGPSKLTADFDLTL